MTLTLDNPVKETSPITNEKLAVDYKITELGMIPENWNVIQFSDLLEFRNGVNADKVAYGKGIPFINVLEVITHSHLSVAKVPGRITLPANVASMYGIRYGDILFNRTSETQEELGLASTYISKSNEKIVFGGFVIRGRPKGDLIDAKYSGYAFRSSLIRSQIISRGQGAIRANIGQYDLSKIFIIIPSLKEQQSIAAALSDIDSLINSLDKVITKKRNIKLATMQQLLTGKQRLPGFNGEWKKKQLGEIADCYSGGTPLTSNSHYYNGDIFWITSGDLNQRYIKNVKGKITTLGLNNSAAKMVNNGTLLIALYGATAGVTAITRIDAAINQAILAIIPKYDQVDFLFHYFELKKGWLINTYTQGGQPNLSGDIIKSIEILIPALEEQTAISNILSNMDIELYALEQQLTKARNLKQGMMQELLTGRIRLT